MKSRFFDEIGKTIIGQHDVLNHILIALLCKGHTLIVGVPGLAKTLIIKSMAELLDMNFNRIQFTPDLMPSDITGTEVIDEAKSSGKRSFRFFKGPIFSNIILADEINRTPPKTQSALLEAMQEQRVTTAGKSYQLDKPFFVLATQNPIEQEGTYPLPEAQLDRFMFNLIIDYPNREDEISIVKKTTALLNTESKKIITKKEMLEFQDLVLRVPMADNVVEYAVDLVASTRPGKKAKKFVNELIEWGAGPRATQSLILGAKAHAILNGNPSVNIDDVKKMVFPVLRHRVIASYSAEAEDVSVDEILTKLIS
ncbi:MAG: MoxR family ATPase [Candidatus Neomarinimicrobiota bacterium]|nr:MoxR family ATPase [Candidatus Neomarinimicrobiota bacterium]MEC9007522.1 MoxR family ATPase [Candidatus Neomarinimicrobiota bacterium]MEC9474691.1 MoxR family ATPase [Candidatus Neomarinimicrobiota bacterium]MED5248512.1 MoxR family ATPase [Candidatus Neomarinimicrobiota bacterium]MED5433941.1 MoxR family ATPase [Candidatus Neomarinimicrobiota bacterium]